MDKDTFGIIMVIATLSGSIWWWFQAKGAVYRRQILLAIIWMLIAIFSYITGMSFDIWPLVLLSLIAIFATLFFLTKAAIAEYRTKHSSSHE